MKKCLLLILSNILIISSIIAQDKIVKTDGSQIHCNIIAADSARIHYSYFSDNAHITTFIDTSDILYYEFKGKVFFKKKKKLSITQKTIFADSVENLNKYIIYTYSGNVMHGRTIAYKQPFLGSSRFILDSKEVKPDIVKFYKDETGFYANTKDLNFTGSSVFTERIRRGKINLYEEETTNYHAGYLNPSTGMYGGGMVTTRIKNYYNIGFEELKKANYQNLSRDLIDNPESMMYLYKFKSIRDAQTVLGIVGGGLIIAGFATLVNKTKDWDGSDKQPEPKVTANIATICIGAGCLWTTYFMHFAKPKQLRRAIDAYNK